MSGVGSRTVGMSPEKFSILGIIGMEEVSFREVGALAFVDDAAENLGASHGEFIASEIALVSGQLLQFSFGLLFRQLHIGQHRERDDGAGAVAHIGGIE